MKRLIKSVSIILFLLLNIKSNATHIVGGDVVYTCVSSDPVNKTTTFNFTFTIYRDVSGTGVFDLNPSFGVYKQLANGSWEFYNSVTTNLMTDGYLENEIKCVLKPDNTDIQKGVYTFNTTLPWDGSKYQVAYQRCCRNGSITNIEKPLDAGAAYTIDLYPKAIMTCNNSPKFKKFPPLFLCIGKDINFDHGASDLDGDKIEYKFCTPKSAGGNLFDFSCKSAIPDPASCLPPFEEIIFKLPSFSEQNPIVCDPIISINNITGLISGKPLASGQYVVGICGTEYRNGEVITEFKRDFQFYVRACEISTQNTFYTICNGDSLKINNEIYKSAGDYIQNFTTKSGCDSILNINIKVKEKKQSNLSYKLCDDEEVSVNGVVYSTNGQYKQNLLSKEGCDSTLTINVIKNKSVETVFSFNLCDNANIVLNGVPYTKVGQYSQKLISKDGCDSILIINVENCEKLTYDFENCNANDASLSMDYSEFTPTYSSTIDCGTITASNIFREKPFENKHSCTDGHTGKAMCISSYGDCKMPLNGEKAIVFEVNLTPNADAKINLTSLSFFHKSPKDYKWLNGGAGKNNYPLKFGFRIFKDNVKIFEKGDISTNNDWQEEKNTFPNSDLFSSTTVAKLRFEITPYCPVNNGQVVLAWDIDDLQLVLNCGTTTKSKIISGKVVNLISHDMNKIEIFKYEDNGVFVSTKLDSLGNFMFNKNDATKKYTLKINTNLPSSNLHTLDLVKIQSHILGIKKFNNPYDYIAGDINNDNKITVTDLVELRKVILGMQSNFKYNKNYLFVKTPTDFSINPWSLKKDIIIQPSLLNQTDLIINSVQIGKISH